MVLGGLFGGNKEYLNVSEIVRPERPNDPRRVIFASWPSIATDGGKAVIVDAAVAIVADQLGLSKEEDLATARTNIEADVRFAIEGHLGPAEFYGSLMRSLDVRSASAN